MIIVPKNTIYQLIYSFVLQSMIKELRSTIIRIDTEYIHVDFIYKKKPSKTNKKEHRISRTVAKINEREGNVSYELT